MRLISCGLVDCLWKRSVCEVIADSAAKFDLGGPDVLARLLERVAVFGEVEQVGDGLERVVDLVRDGACKAADDGELLALHEGQLGLSLLGDLKRGSGDGLDVAVLAVDGEVTDGPVAVLVGRVSDELALKREVNDGLAARDLIEKLLEARDRGHFSERAADDLLRLETEESGLTIVETKIVVVVEIKQGETDGRGAVDGLDFGALAFGFVGLGEEGLAIELLLGEVAEEDDDSVFGGVALDAEPDVEWLGIEGFELAGKLLVHAAAIVLEVRRVFVDDGRECLEEVFANKVSAHGDELVRATVEVGEVVVAVEKYDSVGGRFEALLHLPTERFGLEVGARGEFGHRGPWAMPSEMIPMSQQ